MKITTHKSRVKSRTMHCAAFCLALALPNASRAQVQCYIDPVTGERVCAGAPGLMPGPRAPALDSRPTTLDPASPHCRITVGDGTAGSGTLVARLQSTAIVLTCSHLFDQSTENIVVSFPNGQRLAAAIVDRDRASDLAALVIRTPDVEPVNVYDASALDSRLSALDSFVLTACGYGPNGQFRCVRGAVAGQATPSGATFPSLVIRGAVRPGDSGGGVLNTRGELVGVVWGQRDGFTYATCGRPVREFLDRVLGKQGAGSGERGAGGGKQGVNDKSLQPPAPSPSLDWQSRLSELDARLRALDVAKQDKGDFLRRGELPNVSERFESITSRIEAVHERIEHVAEIAQQGGGMFSGLSIGKLLVGALGLSGPPAVALIAAVSLFRVAARFRVGGVSDAERARSRSEIAPTQLPVPTPFPIAVDTPPPPQRSVTETHYVPYEQDSFAKAHQWACEQVVRKYPGATEVLHTQDSLIKQYLAAGK